NSGGNGSQAGWKFPVMIPSIGTPLETVEQEGPRRAVERGNARDTVAEVAWPTKPLRDPVVRVHELEADVVQVRLVRAEGLLVPRLVGEHRRKEDGTYRQVSAGDRIAQEQPVRRQIIALDDHLIARPKQWARLSVRIDHRL